MLMLMRGLCYSRSYNMARLVMKSHFYGAPKGLPLSCLNITIFQQNGWTVEYSAKILDDKLYLRLKRTACLYEKRPDLLRKVLGSKPESLCAHERTEVEPSVEGCAFDWWEPEWWSLKPQALEPKMVKKSDGQQPVLRDQSFDPCREARRYCTICETDSTWSVEWVRVRPVPAQEGPEALRRPKGRSWINTTHGRRLVSKFWDEVDEGDEEEGDREGWYCTLTSYQCLGSCGERERGMWDPLWLGSGIMRRVPEGRVMERWREDEGEEGEDGDELA